MKKKTETPLLLAHFWRLSPLPALEKIAEVFVHGAEKHEPYGWKGVENPIEYYTKKAEGHWKAWKNGKLFEDESGLMSLAHVGANIAILIWHEIQRNRKTD